MEKSIWWIRRDLRLSDNQALAAALQNARRILPVFILDSKLAASPWTGEKRLGFLFAALHSLDEALRSRGARLIFLRGDPDQVLAQLVRSTGAGMVYAEADVSPYARRRDARVRRSVPLMLMPGLTYHAPGRIVKPDGSPYTVFTPFSRAWRMQFHTQQPLPAPGHIPVPDEIPGEEIPSTPSHSLEDVFPAGEAQGQGRLERFTSSIIDRYHEQRDRMDLDGTSSLSPYLRFGMVSIRQAVWAVTQAQQRLAGTGFENGPETWLNELIWREFYFTILYHFPFVRRKVFQTRFEAVPWRNDREEFAAWKAGRTGYPVVDAAMRQLSQRGWMHNRARMISASFLTKDLLIDWRWGERWFMQNLLDGDPAANNGGWQWTAGTGTDAAPYFRVFNPILQAKKFDPHGAYVRRWVPELAEVPDRYIHEPWRMESGQQEQARCIIGKDYPPPMVDHSFARERALAAYHGNGGKNR